MRFRNLRWGILLFVFFTSYLHGIAQLDSTLSSTGNGQIKMRIDSLTKRLEEQTSTFVVFIDIDYQEQKAYGCILRRNDTSITGEKVLISGNSIDKKDIDHRLLQENRKLILDFFNNPDTYLNPTFLDGARREISHDNRMFFAAKKNGQTIFERYFYRSNYLASKNQKLKMLFLKLGDLTD